MNRLFSKLHISSLLQSNAIYSRGFASATLITQRKTKLPKPTPNAYALFIKSQKGTSPFPKFVDIAKYWKTTSDEEKKKFTEEAVKLREDAIAQFEKLPEKEQQKQFDEVAKSRADRKFRTKLPKPTPNSFALFIKSQKGISPFPKLVDIAKKWKTTSDEEKKKFKDEAVKLREDTIAQFEKLTEEEQQEQFDEVNRRRACRKFLTETKCPKRPLNAFILYYQEKYPATSKQDIIESAKKAGEAFKNLSEDEKKPYFDKSKQQFEAYKSDYEKWYKVHGEDYKKF